MNRKKQIFSTMAGISFFILLFFLAMFLPKYIHTFLDEKNLNQVTYRNINMKTYELSYTSFYEKLNAIARCDKEILHVVPVQEMKQWMKNDKLTAIIQKELDLIAKENRLLEDMDIRLKSGKITSTEMFTLYSSSEGKYLKGITFWKVTYKQKKGTFVIYLDEEYHKIYTLKITLKEKSSLAAYTTTATDTTTAASATDYEVSYYKKTDTPETIYAWIEKTLKYYYGLEHADWDYYYPSPNTSFASYNTIYTIFEDGSSLEMGYQCKITKRKNKRIFHEVFGIYLEEMLQV